MTNSKYIVKQKGVKKRTQDKICMGCGGYTRNFRSYKNMFLCYKCYCKKVNIIQYDVRNCPTTNTIEKALSKTYKINRYLSANGKLIAYRSFPQILIGRKVKLVLVK